METVKKICPQTKKVFFGRSNQIYINRKAQQDFNNIKARKKRLIKSPTDRVLDHNRNVLIRILGKNSEIIVTKEFLRGAQFDFKHFSKSLRFGEFPCQVIYEYCVIHCEKDMYKIKKLVP